MSDDEWQLDFEETEEAGATRAAFLKPPQLLVAIDTHPSMFVKTEQLEVHAFHSCLLALHSILNRLLLKTDRRSLAVIVAHDSEDKARIVDFEMPVNEKLSVVRKLLDLDGAALKTEYERSGSFDFASFLLFAKKQFEKSTVETRTRVLVYFTNDSDPIGADAKVKFRALNEARNFPALKTTFDLVTLSKDFNWDTFYEEMYKAMDTNLTKEYCEEEDGVIEKLLPILEPAMHHRSVRFFPSVTNPKIYMKVSVQSFFTGEKLLSNRKLTRDKHAEVRRIKCGGVTEKTAVVGNDVRIPVRSEEEELLRSSRYPVGYALIGVTKETSEPEMVIRKHDMMYENAKESHDYFVHFWKYCAERSKVLLCSYRPTKSSQPGFCELIPKVYGNKRAFLVKYLHFAEDALLEPAVVVQHEAKEKTESPKLTETLTKLVGALTFSYSPDAFVDVQGMKQEAYVKAQALDEKMETVEDFFDCDEQVDKSLAELNLAQKREDDEDTKKAGGRKKAGGGRGRKAK